MKDGATVGIITGINHDGEPEVLAIGDIGEIRPMWEDAVFSKDHKEVSFWERPVFRSLTQQLPQIDGDDKPPKEKPKK